MSDYDYYQDEEYWDEEDGYDREAEIQAHADVLIAMNKDDGRALNDRRGF